MSVFVIMLMLVAMVMITAAIITMGMVMGMIVRCVSMVVLRSRLAFGMERRVHIKHFAA